MHLILTYTVLKGRTQILIFYNFFFKYSEQKILSINKLIIIIITIYGWDGVSDVVLLEEGQLRILIQTRFDDDLKYKMFIVICKSHA